MVPLNAIEMRTDGEEVKTWPDSIEGAAKATRAPCNSPGGAAILAVLLLSLGGASAAEEAALFYRFVDERGVTHFSNVGSADPRYRPMVPSAPRRRPVRGPRRADYDQLIEEVAGRHALSPALLKAVVAAESGFDPQAISRAGAQGLMQLMPATAEELGVENPLVPEQNLHGGGIYLRLLIDRYGDLTRALAAYNAGPGAVDRYGGLPPYRETRAFVERVLAYYRSYHGDFAR